MAHLIDKDAVLAEIDRRIDALSKRLNEREKVVLWELQDLRMKVDSLEVTEVAKITQHDIKIYINNKAQKGK